MIRTDAETRDTRRLGTAMALSRRSRDKGCGTDASGENSENRRATETISSLTVKGGPGEGRTIRVSQ